jgi:hypothetical protein
VVAIFNSGVAGDRCLSSGCWSAPEVLVMGVLGNFLGYEINSGRHCVLKITTGSSNI